MNRRELLMAAASAAPAGGAAETATPFAVEAEAVVRRYFDFGVKRSGGAGDAASGAWLQAQVEAMGYHATRQPLTVPFYTTTAAALEVGDRSIEVIPQPPFLPTPPGGVEARLVRWWPGAELRGRLAVIALPFRRWSSFKAPDVERPVRAALAAGAAGVVVITTGPSGETLGLNIEIDAQPFSAPVVLLGSRAGAAVLQAADAGGTARLRVQGEAGTRSAFNLLARREGGAHRWLVISTPRSGWTGAAGERGPGVALWLSLARWAATAPLNANVALLSTTAHEYENAGGRLALSTLAPKPEETALWVHLGANIATRDYHDLATLSPLPSPDPQRILAASDALLPLARRAFAGQAGLEAPYGFANGAEGELKEILAAGYRTVIGVYGSHRFHHALADTPACVDGRHVAAADGAFRQVITAVLRG